MRSNNTKGCYLARKPRTPRCAESNKTLKPTVPLTQAGIDRLGGPSYAAKQIERTLGYPVNIKVVKEPKAVNQGN